MEFLEITLYDDDFVKLLFRFALNLIFTSIVIRYLYYRVSRRRDYLFTYYMISIIVFFICFTLKKFELDLGMALGLFAIFGIIRYRTDTIPIKEMTYLFVVIGMSVINALANKKMSYAEILLANMAIVSAVAILEFVLAEKKLIQQSTKKVLYANMENIKPENSKALKADLESITGIKIDKVKIGSVNLENNTANITIYYVNGE